MLLEFEFANHRQDMFLTVLESPLHMLDASLVQVNDAPDLFYPKDMAKYYQRRDSAETYLHLAKMYEIEVQRLEQAVDRTEAKGRNWTSLQISGALRSFPTASESFFASYKVFSELYDFGTDDHAASAVKLENKCSSLSEVCENDLQRLKALLEESDLFVMAVKKEVKRYIPTERLLQLQSQSVLMMIPRRF